MYINLWVRRSVIYAIVEMSAKGCIIIRERYRVSYLAFGIKQLNSSATAGMPDRIVFALFVITHIVERCCGRRRTLRGNWGGHYRMSGW